MDNGFLGRAERSPSSRMPTNGGWAMAADVGILERLPNVLGLWDDF